MPTFTASTRVARRIPAVFHAHTQLELAAKRLPCVEALTPLTEGAFGEGTRWREIRKGLLRRTETEWRVTDFHPPHWFHLEAKSRGTRWRSLVSFEGREETTRVTWELEAMPLTLRAQLAAPIARVLGRGRIERAMGRGLEAVRKACESRTTAAAPLDSSQE